MQFSLIGNSKYKTKRVAPQPPCRKSSNEPIYEPLVTETRKNDNVITNDNTDAPPPPLLPKAPNKHDKSTHNKHSDHDKKPNPPPVDAITIVNDQTKSKRNNNVNGNENVNKKDAKAIAKAQDSSQQGRGVRLPPRATIEKQGDSRKSSVSSTSGAQMWPKCRTSSLADPTPEQVRTEARGLVEVVRELTGLSHTVSQVRQIFEAGHHKVISWIEHRKP